MRIAIAGGGPGGLFAAVVLAQSGHDVVVFERSESDGDTGAGIQISPNGTRLLRDYGLLDAAKRVAFEPQAAVLARSDTGATVFRTPLGAEAVARYGAPYLHLHRADLSRVLSDAVLANGVDLRKGVRVDRFDAGKDEISVRTSNDALETFDLLVGADGIHSTVRRILFGDERACFTGHVAWRGMVPADRVPSGLIAPDATVWAGPGRHFVHYYVRGGALINFVAVEERDAWTEETWQADGSINEVRMAFASWSSGIAAVLNATDECNLWGLFDRAPLERWCGTRVVLLGDACHPMLPYMAQGAVMAFEDAVVLSRSLQSNTDIADEVTEYENIRKPRAIKVQDRARRNGKLFHERSGLVRAMTLTPLSLTGRLLPGVITRQLDWIYGYDASAVAATRIG